MPIDWQRNRLYYTTVTMFISRSLSGLVFLRLNMDIYQPWCVKCYVVWRHVFYHPPPLRLFLLTINEGALYLCLRKIEVSHMIKYYNTVSQPFTTGQLLRHVCICTYIKAFFNESNRRIMSHIYTYIQYTWIYILRNTPDLVSFHQCIYLM